MGGKRDESEGRFGKEGRVSSSCNAIDPVAVHHVDTILVRSFQIAGVVGVGFCAITSVTSPVRTHATHAHMRVLCGVSVSYVYAGCTRARMDEGRVRGAALKERGALCILAARSFGDAMSIARNSAFLPVISAKFMRPMIAKTCDVFEASSRDCFSLLLRARSEWSVNKISSLDPEISE